MGEDGASEVESWIAQVVGQPVVSDWVTVDQAMITGFADVTRDWNFLHVDEDAAQSAGMDRTIAHGFLTLSLLSPMRMDAGLVPCPGLKMAMNYGLDGVRFLAPVYAGDRVRGHFTTREIVETQPGRYRETVQASVEIEGQDRPALVATWLALYMT
ncbi:MaoC family dehydratase [Novosphingobium album (ex Hu et al. 2023)]|uniref:MaoC family dehydratase n=1 Tax=Novosphingobium album (ex Hu et al. 2023) TaxID=2930093 RepID=A0ABT0B3P7_9SPHN|nr:MaoC family dehydratase [Novosphingobium album (ex Hu et al. 2023)]MCJ2179459.1 MaoC family dehydratase [Novosphingobium album (ex Hu et al. 2023)]